MRFVSKLKSKQRWMIAMIMLNYKDERRRSGAGSHGKRAGDTLVEKYCFEVIRN